MERIILEQWVYTRLLGQWAQTPSMDFKSWVGYKNMFIDLGIISADIS